MRNTVQRRGNRPIKHAQVAPRPGAASRAMTIRNAAGHLFFVPLLILLWLVFYQNLPADLNGLSIKPNTAGTIDRMVKIGAIAISLALIASRWSAARKFAKDINPGLAAIMLLIPLSATWSIDSPATLLRFTTLVGIVLLCFAIPLAGWDRKRFQQVTLPPIMLILIASLVIGILSPDSVKEVGEDISLKNSWRGITFQKNQFGMTASVAAILCFHRWISPGKHSLWTIVGGCIALACLILSRSSTSLLATTLALFFMVLVLRVPIVRQRFSTLVVVGIFAVILIYALAIQNLIPGVATLLKPIMQLTGKDMTFSARSVIWDIVKQHSSAAPWLGTGYGAYWTGDEPGSPSYIFVLVMSFYPTEAHNGYLEIMNDLGRVGLTCLLVFLVWFVRQALQLMQFDRSQAVLYLALLYQQMVSNLSESEWFSRTTICTVLILASACLSRGLFEQRQRAQMANLAARDR